MAADMYITKLERKNVVDEVFRQIRANIENNVWKEGDKLPSENELCKLFNVSRVSVRSAMQRLRDDGWILSRQGLGSFVTNISARNIHSKAQVQMLISEKEYIDIIEFRKAIEFCAMDLIVRKGSPEGLAFMKAALDDMRLCEDKAEDYTDADYRFHLGIMKASGNAVFVETMEYLKELFGRYLISMNRASATGLSYSIRNHINIYSALTEKNVGRAKQIILKSMDYNIARFYREEDAQPRKTQIVPVKAAFRPK